MAGLQIIGWQQAEAENGLRGFHKLDRRLYLTNDGKVAEEGDPNAAFLLGAAGDEIPMREAVKLGLAEDKRAEKPVEKPAEKASPKPADKAVRIKEDKGRK